MIVEKSNELPRMYLQFPGTWVEVSSRSFDFWLEARFALGRTHSNKHGSNGIAKNFTECDSELVKRDHVSTESSFNGLCDIHGDLKDWRLATGSFILGLETLF